MEHADFSVLITGLESRLETELQSQAICYASGTIHHDVWQLEVAIQGQCIVIKNLIVNQAHQRQGYGSTVVEALRDLADEFSYTLVAECVFDTAEGFWMKCGLSYISGPQRDFSTNRSIGLK